MPVPKRELTEYTAVSRKVVGKNVHQTISKGNIRYDQYTVPDTVAVEAAFIAVLISTRKRIHPCKSS